MRSYIARLQRPKVGGDVVWDVGEYRPGDVWTSVPGTPGIIRNSPEKKTKRDRLNLKKSALEKKIATFLKIKKKKSRHLNNFPKRKNRPLHIRPKKKNSGNRPGILNFHYVDIRAERGLVAGYFLP
jgi:hypothetical protein